MLDRAERAIRTALDRPGAGQGDRSLYEGCQQALEHLRAARRALDTH